MRCFGWVDGVHNHAIGETLFRVVANFLEVYFVLSSWSHTIFFSALFIFFVEGGDASSGDTLAHRLSELGWVGVCDAWSWLAELGCTGVNDSWSWWFVVV